MKIKTGDNVIMLAGKNRGETGKVLRSLPKELKVVIEGLNLVKKHRRAKKQGQKGETISVSRPVEVSNVMLICRHCKKPARMGIRHENKKIMRICKKCQGEN
ncbi:MAG: large subunit ribosomal protein L24 [Parcubacteria group bacterium Gr01-1014_2]|nr:MAG: large subunit ribosomal protein L24 [Parcubacteria group bacterium Gr01-1014_2]